MAVFEAPFGDLPFEALPHSLVLKPEHFMKRLSFLGVSGWFLVVSWLCPGGSGCFWVFPGGF